MSNNDRTWNNDAHAQLVACYTSNVVARVVAMLRANASRATIVDAIQNDVPRGTTTPSHLVWSIALTTRRNARDASSYYVNTNNARGATLRATWTTRHANARRDARALANANA